MGLGRVVELLAAIVCESWLAGWLAGWRGVVAVVCAKLVVPQKRNCAPQEVDVCSFVSESLRCRVGQAVAFDVVPVAAMSRRIAFYD
jgi:hypothetical protein